MHVATLWKFTAGAILAGLFALAMLVAAFLGWALIRLDIGGPDRVEVME